MRRAPSMPVRRIGFRAASQYRRYRIDAAPRIAARRPSWRPRRTRTQAVRSAWQVLRKLVDSLAGFAFGVDVELPARLFELGAHLGHAACHVILRAGGVSHFLADLHAAEFGAAHGAEMRGLVRFLGERGVVELARGFGV